MTSPAKRSIAVENTKPTARLNFRDVDTWKPDEVRCWVPSKKASK